MASTWFHHNREAALVMHAGYDRARDKGRNKVKLFIREARHSIRRRESAELSLLSDPPKQLSRVRTHGGVGVRSRFTKVRDGAGQIADCYQRRAQT